MWSLAIALERGIEVAAVEERRRGLVDQPLGALECPAAADAPEGVAAERGVADEGEAGSAAGRIELGRSSLPSSFDSRVAPAMPGASGSDSSIRR